MTSKDKLKCFFKMFVSSTGRKTNGKNPLLTGVEDQLGNMTICAPAEVKNSRLAQMITDFYVKKDGCAYIQIADKVHLFDERHNPLGIDNLPVFKEVMTTFIVALVVSDKLDKIKLSVTAVEPEKSAYAGKSIVSFVERHPDYICKVLKHPIEVTTKS